MRVPLVDLKAQYESIKADIDCAISGILENASFIMGKPVEHFERNLAGFCACKHAITTSSGSSALLLALKAYGIKEGDEVITVPNTFIATVEAIVHCGAKPVFVDVLESTMLMDASRVEACITPRTRMIIPVHLYGQICDMDAILQIAKRHNLHVVEDAAQAIDSEYKGRKLPIHQTAILSFFPAKNLGCYGDGGAVITKDDHIASKVAKLRDHGRISKYNSDIIGFGERLDALQAAILDVKITHLKDWTSRRRELALRYNSQLANLDNIRIPVELPNCKHVYYMYVLRAQQRDELMAYLDKMGVSSGIHYPIPLHLQPAFRYLGYGTGDFPVSEKACAEIISIPIYPELKMEQQQFIIDAIRKFHG